LRSLKEAPGGKEASGKTRSTTVTDDDHQFPYGAITHRSTRKGHRERNEEEGEKIKRGNASGCCYTAISEKG